MIYLLTPIPCIVTGDDTEYHKPDPRVFDSIFTELANMNIYENHSIYVGDSLSDYESAKNRGVEFYAVTTGFTSSEQFLMAGLNEEYVLPSFDMILNFYSTPYLEYFLW